MKKKIFAFTVFLLFLSISFAETNSISFCTEEYEKIVRDESLDSLKKKLNAWSKYEKLCRSRGDFQIHTMDLMLRYGKGKEAIEYAECELSYGNAPKELYYRAGEIYGYLRMHDKLYNIADYLIKKHPEDFFGYNLLGDYYFRKNNWKLANEKYLYALSKNGGKNANNYLPLITTSYFLQDYKSACLYYKKAADLNPWLTILSKGDLSAAVKSFIHIGNLPAAKCILNNQLKFDKGVEEFEGFQEALKMYQEEVKKQNRG